MRIRKTNAWWVLMAAVLVSGCASTIRTHPDFKRHRAKMHSVAVLSSDVDFFERTATVNEPKPEFKKEVSENVRRALENVLKKGRLMVTSTGLSDSLLLADQDLALTFTRIRQSFAAACDSIAKTKGKTTSASVSPEIGQFADLAETDYLILARGTGFQSSGGAKAKDVGLAIVFWTILGATTNTQWNGLFLEIGLIDGNTGQVLWYNRNKESNSSYKPRDPRSVEELCRQLLKKLIES